jgi:hypothetical protein
LWARLLRRRPLVKRGSSSSPPSPSTRTTRAPTRHFRTWLPGSSGWMEIICAPLPSNARDLARALDEALHNWHERPVLQRSQRPRPQLAHPRAPFESARDVSLLRSFASPASFSLPRQSGHSRVPARRSKLSWSPERAAPARSIKHPSMRLLEPADALDAATHGTLTTRRSCYARRSKAADHHARRSTPGPGSGGPPRLLREAKGIRWRRAFLTRAWRRMRTAGWRRPRT